MEKNYEIERLIELYSVCSANTNNDEMDIMESLPPDDERWLMEAIRSDFIDPIQRIKENIIFIRDNINNRTTLNHLAECILAIKELQDITENLDFARDFVKLGGLNLIKDLLMEQNIGIRCESAELLGNVNQNNLFCQSESIRRNIIEELVFTISREDDVFLLKKLIYALSCTVRGNVNAFERFIQTDGFDLMLNMLQSSPITAIRCKIAFFIYCLLSEMNITSIGLRKIEVFMENFINCLINLSSFSELETEHLLGSLCFLIKNYPFINFQKRFELVNHLRAQLPNINQLPEAEEIVSYIDEILTILDNRSLSVSK